MDPVYTLMMYGVGALMIFFIATITAGIILGIFLMLVELSHKIDRKACQGYVDARDYEGLELFIVKNLMGKA